MAGLDPTSGRHPSAGIAAGEATGGEGGGADGETLGARGSAPGTLSSSGHATAALRSRMAANPTAAVASRAGA